MNNKEKRFFALSTKQKNIRSVKKTNKTSVEKGKLFLESQIEEDINLQRESEKKSFGFHMCLINVSFNDVGENFLDCDAIPTEFASFRHQRHANLNE